MQLYQVQRCWGFGKNNLAIPTACLLLQGHVWKIIVHQMLPWFQSILDLAPTWRCSMRWNCRNNTIPEVLSFSQKRKLQVVQLQNRLFTKFRPGLFIRRCHDFNWFYTSHPQNSGAVQCDQTATVETHAYNSWGSVIFQKRTLQFLLLQKRLRTEFWPSLRSRQNEIQPSVLLKLAYAASKRCCRSKSKGRITFCAPECFSWSAWHSALGCVFWFVGSIRVATLL